jgi:putative acetyltransferase
MSASAVTPATTIALERPDRPDVAAALARLDAYLGSLYAPEANHILDARALLDAAVRFYVARVGGVLAGTGAFRAMPGEPATGGEAYGEVKRMYVEPPWRGRGLGARLLATLEAGMRDAGIRLALLETGRDQHEAVRLYRRHGYAPHAAFGGYPDNGLSVFLAKRLAP